MLLADERLIIYDNYFVAKEVLIIYHSNIGY